MPLDEQTVEELNYVIRNGAIEEFVSMLIDNARAYPKFCKDHLITNAALYSVEKLRKEELEQASIEQ